MELRVTVQLDGMDVPCGTLYTNVRRGQQSASFAYDRSYILRKNAFEISPDLPLGEATIHTAGELLFWPLRTACPTDGVATSCCAQNEGRLGKTSMRLARSGRVTTS